MTNIEYEWTDHDQHSHIIKVKRVLRSLVQTDLFWLNVDEITVCEDFEADFRMFLACIKELQPELIAFCNKDQI